MKDPLSAAFRNLALFSGVFAAATATAQITTLVQPVDVDLVIPAFETADDFLFSTEIRSDRNGDDLLINEDGISGGGSTSSVQATNGSGIDGAINPFSITMSAGTLTVSAFGDSVDRSIGGAGTLTSLLVYVQAIQGKIDLGSTVTMSNLSYSDSTAALNPATSIAIAPATGSHRVGFIIENLAVGLGDFSLTGDFIIDDLGNGDPLDSNGFAPLITKGVFSTTTTAVPEPGAYAALFGLLAAGWVALRRRRSL